MASQRIVIPYAPRKAFLGFHERKERWSCTVAHRRAGKTVAAINDLIKAALTCRLPNPRFAYISPYFAQSKDVAWGYLKQFTAPIPGIETNESELRIDIPGGARIRLYGADNYDRLRGIYLDGVVLDEFADMHPRAWSEVIRPALSDRQGWAAFIGTPKGKNAFYDVYERAVQADDWFDLRLKASETGIIPEAELDALRAEMSEDEFEREMETSFDAAIEGAYYATQLGQARKDGRVGNVAADPLMQYRAFWDIGTRDATAIWVAQFVSREMRVLDYYEAVGQPLGSHLGWLRDNGYGKALCVLPHDGANLNHITADKFEDHVREAGFPVEVVQNQGKGAALKRIEAARRLFPRIWFNEPKVRPGLDALASYHEKRDEIRNIGLGPEHDWSSHGADAFGLMCVAYEEPRIKTDAKPVRRPQKSWMGAR